MAVVYNYLLMWVMLMNIIMYFMGYISSYRQKVTFFKISTPFTGLKKWVEVGNSGVFRPEMLLPMRLPDDVSVIAWGLSLER